MASDSEMPQSGSVLQQRVDELVKDKSKNELIQMVLPHSEQGQGTLRQKNKQELAMMVLQAGESHEGAEDEEEETPEDDVMVDPETTTIGIGIVGQPVHTENNPTSPNAVEAESDHDSIQAFSDPPNPCMETESDIQGMSIAGDSECDDCDIDSGMYGVEECPEGKIIVVEGVKPYWSAALEEQMHDDAVTG